MRQILLNSSGAIVARVPRPIVESGSVLVRVQYSLISVGTEIAPLRSVAGAAPDSSAVERGIEYASLAKHYFRASLRDPRKGCALPLRCPVGLIERRGEEPDTDLTHRRVRSVLAR